MRSANSEQEIKIQATPRPVSRPAAWGRMLATSALLSLGLSSLSGCASVDAKKSSLQPKEEVKVEQIAKKGKHHCTKASKYVTIYGTVRKFTAETCDDWDYVKIDFDNHKFSTELSLHINSDFDGIFTERQIYIGDSNCRSYIIKGKSNTIRFYLITDVVNTDETRKIKTIAIDSGKKITGNSVRINAEQSKETCNWELEFIDSTQIVYTILAEENGTVREAKSFNK